MVRLTTLTLAQADGLAQEMTLSFQNRLNSPEAVARSADPTDAGFNHGWNGRAVLNRSVA